MRWPRPWGWSRESSSRWRGCYRPLVRAFVRPGGARPRSHGFWRFWAWEAIAALVALNAPVWFRAPLAWQQLISWPLLFLSLVPLALGVQQLRRARRSISIKRHPFSASPALLRDQSFRRTL